MSKQVKIGNVAIGGGAPVAVQTMCDIKTSLVSDVVREIEEVTLLGCDIIRVSVKDTADAEAVALIKKRINIPLVCDIHFDYKLAIKSLDNGADKIRINPGNIGSAKNVEEVARALKANGAAVRVGSNSGSIDPDYLVLYGRSERALAESALKNVKILEKAGVSDIVVSAKASDVALTVKTYRYLAEKTDYPLHLGVTEAGTEESGIVKSSIGIGSLLLDGIGDTLRVSLTAPIDREILAAKRILRSVGLDKNYVEVISCPTCGRTQYDLKSLVQAVEKHVANVKRQLKIAVMGCVVNGPGEAKDADLGIAGGEGRCVIFKKGAVVRAVETANAEREFLKEIDKIINEQNN